MIKLSVREETTPKITFSSYLRKIKGKRRTTSLTSSSGAELLITFIGASLGIGIVAVLSLAYKMPLLVPSFGASATLIYGAPKGPFAQPRNVILGHILSAAVGVGIYTLFGLTWWSATMATSIAIVAMLFTKTTHPPAGATAMIAVLTKASPIFIITPVAIGAMILVLIGLIVNNFSVNRSYPNYWV